LILTSDQIDGLELAIKSADLLGIQVEPGERIADVALAVLTLPEVGPEPNDRRATLRLRPVGRLAALLRHGAADDPAAVVEPFSIDELDGMVRRYSASPLIAWFFDSHAERLARWSKHSSLDWEKGDDGRSHTLFLVQDEGLGTLEIVIWFDELEVLDPSSQPVPIDAFIAGGRRWWAALQSGDPRTRGHGIGVLREGKPRRRRSLLAIHLRISFRNPWRGSRGDGRDA
jgi:hypothetical protein